METSIVTELTTDQLLELLPRKTYNIEPFGLMIMADGDGINWTVQYYTHYSKKSDYRIPQFKGKSINDCLLKLFDWFKLNMPEAIGKSIN